MNPSVKSVGTPTLYGALSIVMLWGYGLTGLPPMPIEVAAAFSTLAITVGQSLQRWLAE